MTFPVTGMEGSPGLLVLLGLAVGTLGGFLGIGGAFLATPALSLLGFPMAWAIGTDLAAITGTSLVAASLHRRLGNVDLRAALLMALGTAPGVELGARAVLALEGAGLADAWVRWAYVLLLAGVALFMLRDLRARRAAPARPATAPPSAADRAPGYLAALRLPPLVSLPASGIPAVSAWAVIGVGLATGFLAGFLGVGGGFVRVPALLYLLGMPMRAAVGTDLVEILLSSTYGTFTYALKGRVDLPAALLMLAGGALGSQAGVLATRYARFGVRLPFALTMLLAAAAVALHQLGLPGPAFALLAATGGSMTLAVLAILAAGLRRRRALPTPAGPAAHRA